MINSVSSNDCNSPSNIVESLTSGSLEVLEPSPSEEAMAFSNAFFVRSVLAFFKVRDDDDDDDNEIIIVDDPDLFGALKC